MESLTEIDRLTGSVYLLRDLIQERLGLSLDDDRGQRLIISRLAGRIKERNYQSFLEYYYLLMSDDQPAEDEWQFVMTALAKSISSFWRHTDPVRTLVDVVLPQLYAASGKEPLRIWSASCGKGEEPLAIAMALNEAGWFERTPIEIVASDANHAAIECAVQGVYCDERVRHLDTKLRDKYFAQDREGWRVLPELHKLIQWKVSNLMIPENVAELAQSQIIFCRNVFIYFTGHAICKTLHLFGRFMPAGAYLFSDSGDFVTTLISESNLFEPLRVSGSDVWTRRDNSTRAW